MSPAIDVLLSPPATDAAATAGLDKVVQLKQHAAPSKLATASDVDAAAKRLGFAPPADHVEDYIALLNATDACAAEIMGLPDFVPPVDYDRFPRKDVHRPADEENQLRGWSYKATVEGEKEGILAGKTVCLKDTICLADVPLCFGTSAFTDYKPSMDATAVTRVLENAGTIVGKATCENFSHGPASFSSPHGPVQNPYAFGFSTGGSSSGCGALVGSGEVDMAIGGDQGGSIRIPATLCGIVGLKPTFGLVPYTGVLSSDSGVDHIGPMTQSVYDAALLLEAIAGYDNIDDRQLGAPLPADVPKYSKAVLAAREKGVKGMKIGILREGFMHKSLDKAVDESVCAAAAKFEQLGATVEEVSCPLHLHTEALCHITNKFASAGTRIGRQVSRRGYYANDYWGQLLPWTQDKWDKAKYHVSGTAMSAEYGWVTYPTIYGRSQNIIRQMKLDYDALLQQYDAIVMPTVTQAPRRHVGPDAGPLAWARCTPGIVSNTAASNLTGHPTVTLPCGFIPPSPADILSPEDEKIRLPCGMMLMGKMFGEEQLLSIADAWETAFNWKEL
ncbi:hypothetical protein JCM6882_003700 [Rhodosporidiobolus microsporus]